ALRPDVPSPSAPQRRLCSSAGASGAPGNTRPEVEMTRSMIGVVAALLLGASVGVAQDAPAAAVAANAAAAAPFRVERTGSGRAMLLIPGFLSSGEVWQGTVERFRGEYDMHVLTLAGFAGVPPTGADPYLASTRDAIIA